MSFDQSRASDVDQLVGMLRNLTGRDATPEDMHAAWQARSDGVCASWLAFDEHDEDDRQEVRRAHDAFVEKRFDETVLAAVPAHDHELVLEYVRDRGSDTIGDTDDVIVVTDAEGDKAVIAEFTRWSSNHRSLVSDLLERFDVELPDGHDMSDQRILEAFGLDMVD